MIKMTYSSAVQPRLRFELSGSVPAPAARFKLLRVMTPTLATDEQAGRLKSVD